MQPLRGRRCRTAHLFPATPSLFLLVSPSLFLSVSLSLRLSFCPSLLLVQKQLHVLRHPGRLQEAEVVDFSNAPAAIDQEYARRVVELAVGCRAGPHAPGGDHLLDLVRGPCQESP